MPIRLHGQVLDGAGDPVPDALLEIWQPDAARARSRGEPGSLHRDGWTFTGWGRAATDARRALLVHHGAPGPPTAARRSSPSTVFARGLLDRLFTRAYLPERHPALDRDPLLAALTPERRATLVAVADATGYRFDIVLQGAGETVFLEHTNTASIR